MAEEEKTEPTSKSKPPHEPSQEETAAMIADELGQRQARVRVPRSSGLYAGCGRTQARALLQQVLVLEAGDGMMVQDGSRHRTPGGIYFHLAYTTGKNKRNGKPLKRPMVQKQGEEAPQPLPAVTFTWKDRIAVIQEAEAEKGQANVKITVVGRPGKVVDRGQCIVTVMESNKVPALPKGLPTPPAVPTKYTVYIGSKQWKKVAEAIRDPEDTLIIEGFPTMDAEIGSIAVFATNTTTKKLQMAKSVKQGEAAEQR